MSAKRCKVVAREGEELDMLLKRFRRQVNDCNILGECKKRESYMSKAEKRREKSKQAKLKEAKARRGIID